MKIQNSWINHRRSSIHGQIVNIIHNDEMKSLRNEIHFCHDVTPCALLFKIQNSSYLCKPFLFFRFHIKAIKSLMEDLPDHGEALIANLDLILKWLTLRFFDTNPSVLLKGLEYLHSIFNMLSENQYRMLENEGSSFVPYLVLKVMNTFLAKYIARSV